MDNSAPSRRAVMTQSLALAAAGALGAPAGATAAAAAPATAWRVVFQVSDADPMKWNLTLNNTRNAQAELGADNVKIEVVAFGPGIAMLMADSAVAERVAEAIRAGVAIYACENTMRGQKLTRPQMVATTGYVPSGVAHLIRRQADGYAYLRS